MLEDHTKKDIEKISYDILKSSKSWGKFPTPVDQIVSYSELIIDKQLSVSEIHHGYLARASDTLRKALTKIEGIFDRKQKTIYLDLSQKDAKQNFVKLHETGHGVLEWQNATVEFLDDKKTLSEDYQEQFEAEANYFASGTLFQLERFNDELLKLEFGIKSGMALGKLFGGSIHSALRRYAEYSPDCCALLVLNPLTGKGNSSTSAIRDCFHSPKFLKKFGVITLPESFDTTWPFIQDYRFRKMAYSTSSFHINGEIVELKYDFFTNSFNAFILVYPDKKIRSGKTKVIITDNSGVAGTKEL